MSLEDKLSFIEKVKTKGRNILCTGLAFLMLASSACYANISKPEERELTNEGIDSPTLALTMGYSSSKAWEELGKYMHESEERIVDEETIRLGISLRNVIKMSNSDSWALPIKGDIHEFSMCQDYEGRYYLAFKRGDGWDGVCNPIELSYSDDLISWSDPIEAMPFRNSNRFLDFIRSKFTIDKPCSEYDSEYEQIVLIASKDKKLRLFGVKGREIYVTSSKNGVKWKKPRLASKEELDLITLKERLKIEPKERWIDYGDYLIKAEMSYECPKMAFSLLRRFKETGEEERLFTGITNYLGTSLVVPYLFKDPKGNLVLIHDYYVSLRGNSAVYYPIYHYEHKGNDLIASRLNLKDITRDSDGDGLTDIIERWSTLNPYNADTDGDGKVDGVDENPLVKPHTKTTYTILQQMMVDKVGGLGGGFVLTTHRQEFKNTGRILCLDLGNYPTYIEYNPNVALVLLNVELYEDNKGVCFRELDFGWSGHQFKCWFTKSSGKWKRDKCYENMYIY